MKGLLSLIFLIFNSPSFADLSQGTVGIKYFAGDKPVEGVSVNLNYQWKSWELLNSPVVLCKGKINIHGVNLETRKGKFIYLPRNKVPSEVFRQIKVYNLYVVGNIGVRDGSYNAYQDKLLICDLGIIKDISNQEMSFNSPGSPEWRSFIARDHKNYFVNHIPILDYEFPKDLLWANEQQAKALLKGKFTLQKGAILGWGLDFSAIREWWGQKEVLKRKIEIEEESIELELNNLHDNFHLPVVGIKNKLQQKIAKMSGPQKLVFLSNAKKRLYEGEVPEKYRVKENIDTYLKLKEKNKTILILKARDLNKFEADMTKKMNEEKSRAEKFIKNKMVQIKNRKEIKEPVDNQADSSREIINGEGGLLIGHHKAWESGYAKTSKLELIYNNCVWKRGSPVEISYRVKSLPGHLKNIQEVKLILSYGGLSIRVTGPNLFMLFQAELGQYSFTKEFIKSYHQGQIQKIKIGPIEDVDLYDLFNHKDKTKTMLKGGDNQYNDYIIKGTQIFIKSGCQKLR